MKGMGIMELISFLLHRRNGLPLRRDLTFIAVADEEAGSAYGVEFLAREHRELFDCEYVINEGGAGSSEVFGVERPVFNIGVAEKGPLWLKLTAQGRPGHGSVPHEDNAADRLVRALQKVQDWERPRIPQPAVMQYLGQLHDAGIIEDELSDEVLERLAEEHPRVRSMQMNSISLTTIDAGVKHNVIPAAAHATLDCRLVPGYDADRFVAELKAVIDDDAIEIEEIFRSSTPASPLDSELYAVMTAGPRRRWSRTRSWSPASRPASRTPASSAASASARTASSPSSSIPTTRGACTATTSVSRSRTCGWGSRFCTQPYAASAASGRGSRLRWRGARKAHAAATSAPVAP